MLKKVFKYFFKGLLIIAPIVIIAYIIIGIAAFLKNFFPSSSMLNTFFGIVLLIIVVGFLFDSRFAQKMNIGVKKILRKFPLAYHLYISINKLITSFVGKNGIFENPVWVDMGNDRRKIGFVTRENMEEFNLMEYATVYFPNSFSLSGETMVIPKDQIFEIQTKKEKALALALSGGIRIKENE